MNLEYTAWIWLYQGFDTSLMDIIFQIKTIAVHLDGNTAYMWYSCFALFFFLLLSLISPPASPSSFFIFIFLFWLFLVLHFLTSLSLSSSSSAVSVALRSQWVWLRVECGAPPLSLVIKAMPSPRLHMSSRPSKRGDVLLIRSVSCSANAPSA